MNGDLLVSIAVPIMEDKYFFATGYPVGKDLVMTTRHVFTKPGRNKNAPFKLRFHGYHAATDNGYSDLTEEAIVWQGEQEALDVVLIHYPFPPGVPVESNKLTDITPASNKDWNSQGFPNAAHYNDKRNPHAFIGKITDRVGENLQFTCSSGPETKDGWGGASGMPIFVDDRIVGVCRDVLDGFRAESLRAVPVCELLKDKKFAELVGWTNRKKHSEKVRKEVITVLLGSENAIKVLAEIYNINPSADKLANALLQQGSEAIPTLEKAYSKLREDPKEMKESISAIRSCVEWIFPLYASQGGLLHAHGKEKKNKIIYLQVATDTIAEVTMAGKDGRSLDYYQRTGQGDLPKGRANRSYLPPEGGFKDNNQTCFQHVEKQIIGDFGNEEILRRRGKDEHERFINDEIKCQSEKGLTSYFTFDATSELSDYCQKLQERFPSFVVINLSNEKELFDREIRAFREIRDIVSPIIKDKTP